MKGQMRTGMKVMAVLFASAALTLAQVDTVSAPAAQPQGPYGVSTQQAATAPYAGPRNGASAADQAGPGTVNYVEGQAAVNGQNLAQTAVGRVSLSEGGVVDTQDGYAEILLTPGAFLRLGHNSEVRMIHAGLADTRLQVVRGAAEVEVDELMHGAKLSVELNGSVAQIEKNGLYGFDAAQQSVRVLDGRATVDQGSNHTTLGKGHEVVLAGGEPLKKRSFDEKQAKEEPLYVWSRIRSQDEAEASYAAARHAGAFSAVNTGWFWNPYSGFYGFWPTDAYLYSPFGWGFYSPLYFGYYGGGYLGRGYYRPGLYRGAYRSGGFAGVAHGGGFHGAAMHGGGGHR